MNALNHKALENGSAGCQYDDHAIQSLIQTNQSVSEDINVLVSKIDTIIEHNRTFFRYMLIVICIIALGDKSIDLAERFWGHKKAEIVDK